MFWCITCDGYSCMGECVVVAGKSNDAAAVALQMQRFTENITLLTDSAEHSISDTFIRRLDRAHIPLIVDRIAAADGRDGQLKSLYTKSGQRVDLDKLFSVQGSTPQTSLATMLGVTCNQHGYIMADAEQKTNVPGVFAAGDVTRLHSHQVATAVHEGGQAASAANYFLYPPDMKDE
jgi:thioredoxin reductase (NADPH)